MISYDMPQAQYAPDDLTHKLRAARTAWEQVILNRASTRPQRDKVTEAFSWALQDFTTKVMCPGLLSPPTVETVLAKTQSIEEYRISLRRFTDFVLTRDIPKDLR